MEVVRALAVRQQCQAGGADRPDHVPGIDVVARVDQDAIQVDRARLEIVAVVDPDHLRAVDVRRRQEDLALGHGDHRIATEPISDVHAGVGTVLRDAHVAEAAGDLVRRAIVQWSLAHRPLQREEPPGDRRGEGRHGNRRLLGGCATRAASPARVDHFITPVQHRRGAKVMLGL